MAKKKLNPEDAPERLWTSSAPLPIDITTVDEQNAVDRIRTADKADVLTYWRKLERRNDSEPNGRQAVIDAINARLLQVQGPPLAPEE